MLSLDIYLAQAHTKEWRRSTVMSEATKHPCVHMIGDIISVHQAASMGRGVVISFQFVWLQAQVKEWRGSLVT